jgi:hypothetical protein
MAPTQSAWRFKVIVAGAGILNWQSYYGQNNIDEWMIPFFGKGVYQDPNVYAKACRSLLTNVRILRR